MLTVDSLQITPWFKRSPRDRRSSIGDRRIRMSAETRLPAGTEKRKLQDRRKGGERRERWMRVNRWQSILVFED
jgi:hypothetical protein